MLTIIYALPLKFMCRLAKCQLFQLKIDQYFSLYVTNWFDHSKHARRFRKCWFGYCDNTTRRESARTHIYLHFERRILFDICESVSLINGISTTIFRSRRLHDNTTFLCEFHRSFLQTPWNHGWNFYAQKWSIKYFHDYFVSFFLVELDSSPGLWTSVGMPIRLIPGLPVVPIPLVRKLILPE